jgi:hypothetical protein
MGALLEKQYGGTPGSCKEHSLTLEATAQHTKTRPEHRSATASPLRAQILQIDFCLIDLADIDLHC